MVQIPEAFLKPVDIVGWGMHVPERVRTSRELVPRTKYKSVADILRRCGVRERRIADREELCADLATEAGANALRMAGLSADEVSHIVVATTIPDDLLFGASCLVQRNLGARKAAVIDVRAACAGFVKGLEVATCLIDSGRYPNVLLIGAEILSRLFDAEDPDDSIIFGDGAAAVVLARSQRRKPWVFASDDHGEWSDLISRPTDVDRGVVFQGGRVFKEAVHTMVACTSEVLNKARLSSKDVKLFVPHQANLRIIRAVAKHLDLTDRLDRLSRRVFVNIQRYGNTSTASIPIALCEAAAAGRLKRGSLVAMAAFGAGLTAAAALIEW